MDNWFEIFKVLPFKTPSGEQLFEGLGTVSGRPFGVVKNGNKKYAFYRSSGNNSGREGTWFPFHGFDVHGRHPDNPPYMNEPPHKDGSPRKGWFVKPEGSREGNALMQFLMKKMNANPPDFIQLQHMSDVDGNRALQAAGAVNLELY